MKTSSAKGKGREWQQKVRNLLCNLLKLTPEVDIASRQMGGIGADVYPLTEVAKKYLESFYIECKAEKGGFNPHKFIEEHKEFPRVLLFHKRNRGPMLVTMSEHSFTELFNAFCALRRASDHEPDIH